MREHTGSCGDQLSVRVAVGLVAPLLRIGARSGVKNLDRVPTWCLHCSRCAIGAYEGGYVHCQCWSV